MALDLTSFEPILKELYDGQKVKDLVYPKQPFFAMLPKKEDFEGDTYPLPLRFEDNQSISSTFAVGNAVNGNSAYRRFSLTRAKKYGFAKVDGETARASMSNKGAFVAALKSEIDSTMHGVVQSISADLFGNGQGDLAAVTSYTAGTNTLVITNVGDITKLHVGMRIVIFAANGTTQRINGTTIGGIANTFLITARNVGSASSSIVLDADPTSIVATDRIFRAGDKGEVAQGLDAWLNPAPGTAAFFGVNRSVDPTRLAGVHYAHGSLTAIQSIIIQAVSLLNREGGKADKIWLNFEDYADLVVELGSKVEYDRIKPMDGLEGSIGFKSIKLYTAYGEVDVMADPHCSKGIGYGLKMDSWALYSLGNAPMIDTLDGNSILRANGDDSVEARIIAYYQLGSSAPGHNVRFTLP